jgi:hypothetical protein
LDYLFFETPCIAIYLLKAVFYINFYDDVTLFHIIIIISQWLSSQLDRDFTACEPIKTQNYIMVDIDKP